MKVTVENRVKVSADISTDQVVTYARRTGWLSGEGPRVFGIWEELVRGGAFVPAIEVIARERGLQPGDVLREIAGEVSR